MTLTASSIVTDIACACGFVVIIDQPDRQIGISRQIRREWFAHLRDLHPADYAKLSPAFAAAEKARAVERMARAILNAEKHRLAEKKAAKGRDNG